jgi:hypothetical protein
MGGGRRLRAGPARKEAQNVKVSLGNFLTKVSGFQRRRFGVLYPLSFLRRQYLNFNLHNLHPVYLLLQYYNYGIPK